MAEGWIKLNRGLLDNELWISEPFSRGQAWVDLLLLANHKESYFIKRGNKIIVKRGQVGRSMKTLSSRWYWSIGKVNRFLKLLENENQITVEKNNVTTVLTVVKYDSYQQTESQTETKRKPNRNQTKTYKNDNNEKNDKNDKKEGGLTPTQKVLLFDESKYEQPLIDGFKRFCNFINGTIHVLNLPSQINIDSYRKICEEHGSEKLKQKVKDLDNWFDDPNVVQKKKRDKKSLTHLMVNTWLKNGY
jgi:hypothetical protein